MTRDDIIRMAQEAKAGMLHGGEYSLMGNAAIERFAALVANHVLVQPCCGNFEKCQRLCMPRAAAAEREACAKVCAEKAEEWREMRGWLDDFANEIAASIRARGQQ